MLVSSLIKSAKDIYNLNLKIFKRTVPLFLMTAILFLVSCNNKPLGLIERNDWATGEYNSGRTNESSSNFTFPPKCIWSKNISTFSNQYLNPLSKKEITTPVIFDNKLYVGSELNRFTAIDLETKKKLWVFKTAFPVQASATVSDSHVFFGTLGGSIYALSRGDGKVLWTFTANSPVLSSPLVKDNTLYVQTTDNKVHSIDIASGKVIWTYGQLTVENIFRRHETSITLGSENLFVVTNDGMLTSININNGSKVWSKKLISNPLYADSSRTTPIYANNSIYVLDGKGSLLSFNELDGEIAKKYDLKKARDFIISKDHIFIDSYGEIKNYTLSGLLLWTYKVTKDSSIQSLVKTSKYIVISYNRKPWIFGTPKIYVEALDIVTGEPVWSKRFSEPSESGVVFSDRYAALTGTDGTAYILKTNYQNN